MSLEVRAVVVGSACEVRLSHTFEHQRPGAVEAIFAFPLIERAAVCAFEATVRGRRVVGVAREKEEAREVYADAVRRGDDAFLLEQRRPDVFEAFLGNVEPGSPVIVHTTYVCELATEGASLRFVLPTSIAPRYDVAAGGAVAATLAFRSEWLPAAAELRSPSHAALDGAAAHPALAMDRDLVVLARLAAPAEPRALLEPHADGRSYAVQLRLCPQVRQREEDADVEFVFLVDRSGSMAGGKIHDARRALELFVRSLPEGRRFNIVSFGSRHSALFPAPRALDERTFAAALRHVAALAADMGGTELLAPLREVCPSRGRRAVFVLTDGQVQNTEAVLRVARDHRTTTRVFALGVGPSASSALVEGLARATDATAEFVAAGEAPQAKVLRQLRAALQPPLRNVRVRWGQRGELRLPEVPTAPPGKPVGGIVGSLLGFVEPSPPPPVASDFQAPARVPALMSDHPFVIYAVFSGATGTPPPDEVTVLADVGAGTLEATVPVRTTAAGTLLHTLAARRRLAELENAGADAGVRDEMVRLGVRFGLASKHTSFVAVHERQLHERLQLCRLHETEPEPESLRVFKSAAAPSSRCGFVLGGSAPPAATVHGTSSFSDNGMIHAALASTRSDYGAAASRGGFGGGGGGGGARRSSERKKKCKPEAPMRRSRQQGMAQPCPPPTPSAPMMMCDSMAPHGACADMPVEEEDEGEMNFGLFEKEQAEAVPEIRSGGGGGGGFDALIACQRFDGSFLLDEALARALGKSLAELRAQRPAEVGETVWGTLLAITAFRKRFADRRDEWVLIVEKAERFTQSSGSQSSYPQLSTII